MNTGLTAVVLAGVHDWGGCVLNQAVMRPLVPIANRPVVAYALGALADISVSHTVICVNGQGRQMRRAVRELALNNMDISYLQDCMPRGPAGCVKDAHAQLDGAGATSEVIVLEASVICHFDLADLVRAHRAGGSCLTIATRQRSVGRNLPAEPVGVYVFSPQVMAHIGELGYHDIKEGVVPKLADAGFKVAAYAIDGSAPRLSGIASYFRLNEWVLKLMLGGAWPLPGYERKGSALVHVDARVDETARLLGPVMVGPGAQVGDHAVIVGPTSIDSCGVVGEGAVVSRSTVWSEAVVGERAQVDRCLVAQQVRIANDTRHFNAVCLASQSVRKRGPKRVLRHANRKSLGPPVAQSGSPKAKPTFADRYSILFRRVRRLWDVSTS